MPRRKKRQRRSEEEHTYLAVRVERHEARIEASVNRNAYAPQYAWDLYDSDPLYSLTAQLVITGVATYPSNRAGDAYELTIYGDDAPSRHLDATLRDVQVRDSHGAPQYRMYRGREIPVYDPPKGLGFLDKVRGEPRWTGWLFVAPRFVSDALALLAQERTCYVAIHERREGRTRRIQSLTLQTSDPAEE